MPVTAPVMKATLPSHGRSAEVIWFYPLAKTITIVSVAYKPIRESRSMRDMEQRLAALEKRVGELVYLHAIRRLHWAYGYYIDFHLPDEVADLFAEDGGVGFLSGGYLRRAGVKRLYGD